MIDNELAEQLRTKLTSAGAFIVGFADLNILPPEARQGLPVGISIAVALNPNVISGINDGPTNEYGVEDWSRNEILSKLGTLCAQILQAKSYQATVVPIAEIKDRATLSAALQHKTVAVRAGIGWIGKCALLVTEDYGPAIKLATVLTNADLPVGIPIETSRCGSCSECVDICPASAPTGKEWNSSLTRDDFFDVFACGRTIRSISIARNISNPVCGMCIAACPWTKKYLSHNIS